MANAFYNKYLEAVVQHTSNSSMAGSGTTGVYAALVDTATTTRWRSSRQERDRRKPHTLRADVASMLRTPRSQR